MKLKQFLAGVVAAALVVTSVPLPGLRSTQAQAAEEEVNVALDSSLVAYAGSYQQGWTQPADLEKLTDATEPTNGDDNNKWVSLGNIKNGRDPIDNAVSYLVLDLGEGSRTALSRADFLWFNGAYGTQYQLQTCDDYQAPANPNLMDGNTSGSLTTADADYRNGSWETVLNVSRESASKDGFTVFDTCDASNGLPENAKLGRFVRLLVTGMNPAAGYNGPALRKIRLFGTPDEEEPDEPREPVYADVKIRMGAAESQEMTGEGANNGWAKCAVDGNPGTFWHSKYTGGNNVTMADKENSSYFIALEEASSVDKVTYLPRQNDGKDVNGTILKCEVSVTTDALANMPSVADITDQASATAKNDEAIGIFKAEGITWKPVAITTFDTADWVKDEAEKEILFSATEKGVTGIKITVTKTGSASGTQDNQFINCAEFGVKAEVPPVYTDVNIKMGAAESQEMTGEGEGKNGWAKYAVDGNPGTYWHSKYTGGNNVTMANKENSSYFIALEKASSVDKVTYLPRQNDGKDVNGTVLKCEVSVTTDALANMPSVADITDAASATAKNDEAIGIFKAEGITWKPVAITTFDTADWTNDEAEKEILFSATEKGVTGIKITVTKTGSASGTQDNQFINGAEFGVKAIETSVDPGPVDPEPTYVKADIKMGAASSQEMTGESKGANGWAKYAVDGDGNTYWHSKYNGGNDVQIANGVNNSFYMALKKASSVDKITYLPRQGSGDVNGTILKCEVYVTTDRLAGMPSLADITDADSCALANNDAMDAFTSENITWKKVDIKTFDEGNWEFDDKEKEILFDATEEKVTGIQIKVLSTGSSYPSNVNKFISGAEFGVYGKEVPPEPEFVNEAIKMGAAESQEMTGESNGSNGWAKYAVDGKEDTYWHSNYHPQDVDIPGGVNNSYYIAMQNATSVDKITYVPRQTKGVHVNGTILNCDVYVTTDELAGMPSVGDITDQASATAKNSEALNIFKADGVTWKKVETAAFENGNWAYDQNAKEIVFKQKQRNVTGIKITAKATGAQSDTQNDMFISGAEFGVVRRTVGDETPEDAMDELVGAITPAMERICEAGNVSGGEQVYTTASYRRFEAAYAKAASLAAMTDLSNITAEEIKAAKDALEDCYKRLIRTGDVRPISATPDVTVKAPVVGQAPADAELTGETLDTNADVDIEWLEFDEEGGITGKITAPNDRNSVFNVTGDTKFLMHFEMKTAPVSSTQSIIGKLDEQYGLQIESSKILLFGKTTGNWLEVDCPIPADEGWYDEWHDVVGIFNGEAFELYLDGVAGTVPASHAGRKGQLVDSASSVFGIFYNATKEGQEFNGKLRDISMYIGDQVPEYTIGEEDTAEDVMEMFKTLLEGREKSFELNAKAADQQRGYSVKSTTWIPAANVFERYQDYTVQIVLRADQNYEFKENATAVVRTGASSLLPANDVSITADGDEMTISYTFKGEEFPKVTLSKYLNSDELKTIGWNNKDDKGVRKYTAASWAEYLKAYHAASVANGTSGLSADEYTAKINGLKKAITGLKLASENCECELFEITGFTDANVSLGMSAERTIVLGGESKYTNECQVHPSTAVEVKYALVGNPAGAVLSGNELKLTQAGTVQVRMTATLGRQTKTATATYTVTSKRPTDEQKNALASAIADVEQNYMPYKDRYTSVSWRAVTDALETAKKLGATATADRIGDYEKAIKDAVANLVLRDRKSLEDLVSGISALKADDYTADSWNKMKAVYDSAVELLKSATAAMDDYTKAFNDLTAAKAALVTKAAELETAKKAINEALAAAEPVYAAGQGNYTAESWKAFSDAYTAANTAVETADAATLNKLAETLKNAQAALAAEPLKTGVTKTIGKIKYKVLNAEKKTAAVVTGTDKKQKSVTIPPTVKINGVSCKVVQIGGKAFSGYGSLTKVTIGKNVTTVGNSAFKNCGKLKKVIVKGTVLKSIKKSAFAKTASKVTVTVPKKLSKKQYNALLDKMKKAGMSKKAAVVAK